ncbi:MAG TPA: hypothetical protein DD435_14195 [Cyanobacteria bacterium UBA8530]|nr:hypothetical protein [Cyanobacteria bacterium UBA8530]
MTFSTFHQRKSEAGQALIEFALVLPFLVLLTFGCLQAAIFFQHQITLSGAAFLGARAAAVRGPEAQAAAKDVVLSYARASNQKWLSYAERTAQVDMGNGHAAVTLSRKEDWFDAVTKMTVMVGGGSLKKGNPLKQTIILQDEYVKKASGGTGSAATVRTSLMIDYSVGTPANLVPGLDKISGILTSLKSVPGLADKISLDSMLVALNPLEQATVANPRIPEAQGQQNSDQYLDAENETRYFKQAGKMTAGLDSVAALCDILQVAYTAAGVDQTLGPIAQSVVGSLTPLDPALERAANALSKIEPLFKKGAVL